MGRGGWGGNEQKGKRTHGYGQQCSDYRGGEEVVEVQKGIRGINANGKNTIKNKLLKK